MDEIFNLLANKTGNNSWRSTTPLQKQRNIANFFSKRNEKIAFINWVKDFNKDPFGYIKFCNGNYPLPKNNMSKSLALGYISDISEVKRLHNDENTSVEWTEVPFGYTKEEYDNPDLIKLNPNDEYDEELVENNEEPNESNGESDEELVENNEGTDDNESNGELEEILE